jgi:putative ABC transport system ATP-binding protein
MAEQAAGTATATSAPERRELREPDRREGPREGEVIRTVDLRKTYDAGAVEVRAMDGVNLVVRTNEYCAIMGPSGSGKSTLMNLLGCLDTPTSGQYFLRGQEVSRFTEDELAQIRNREIGFVFQTFHLLPRSTAARNVELPLVYSGMRAAERRERARELLRVVGLEARAEHRPNQLSGGERQRVAIARALANRPSLLLADEPTGNLDSRTSGEILALIDQLHDGGHTILLVTHDPEVGKRAHRIIRVRDGLIESDERR